MKKAKKAEHTELIDKGVLLEELQKKVLSEKYPYSAIIVNDIIAIVERQVVHIREGEDCGIVEKEEVQSTAKQSVKKEVSDDGEQGTG